MFDIGWTEMMVVAVVAILFVGPRELPGMLRTFGKMIRKVRGLAGDFQRQFDDALKDAELDGIKKAVDDVRNLDPSKQLRDKLNPLKGDLDKVDKDLRSSVERDADFPNEELEAPAVVQEAAVTPKLAPDSGPNAVPGFGGPKAAPKEKPATAKTAAPKATAKKAPAKKPAVKKPATKTPAAKTAAAKAPAAKKAPAKKPATPKPAAKKTSTQTAATKPKAPAAAKATAKKPVAKKPAAKAKAKA